MSRREKKFISNNESLVKAVNDFIEIPNHREIVDFRLILPIITEDESISPNKATLFASKLKDLKYLHNFDLIQTANYNKHHLPELNLNFLIRLNTLRSLSLFLRKGFEENFNRVMKTIELSSNITIVKLNIDILSKVSFIHFPITVRQFDELTLINLTREDLFFIGKRISLTSVKKNISITYMYQFALTQDKLLIYFFGQVLRLSRDENKCILDYMDALANFLVLKWDVFAYISLLFKTT